MIRNTVTSCCLPVPPEAKKPYVRRRFKLQELRSNLGLHEDKLPRTTIDDVFEEMSETTWPDNISRPLPSSIVKHVESVGFEFVVETSDSIKHYIFEDV